MGLDAGTRLAHYEILGPLGHGGMGQVFRAQDTKLGREVALKLLPTDVGDDPRRLQRLEQEARTLAKLSHPNIVTVFSVEEDAGRRFITMEKIEGRTLDELIGPKGMPVDRLLEVASRLTAAVAAAHEQGVIHRDLKPANVMITPEGTVKVLDFGLAKWDDGNLAPAAASDSGESAPTMTATSFPSPVTEAGTVMGTAPYMSPEQARGEPVDHRSDIFSLGVMLYQMATGRLPFQGRTPVDTVSSILRDTPASVTELKPELPNHLGRIVRRCLEKDPKVRVQAVADLAYDLIDLQGELSGAIPADRPPARRPWSLILGVAAVLVALVSAWQLGWLSRDAAPGGTVTSPAGERTEMIVVFPFENLGPAEDAYFAAGIAEEIGSRLASVGSLGVISRASATQYDRTGKTMATIGDELGVDYVLDGTVRWDRSGDGPSRVRVTPQLIRVADDHQMWSGRFDETLEEIFAVQSRIAESVLQELDLQLHEAGIAVPPERPTNNLAAYQDYLRAMESRQYGSYDPDRRLRTIGLLERAVRADPGFALAWALLSNEQSYFYHLRYDTTQHRIDLAKQAVDRALELEPDLPQARHALGLYYYRCHRDYERALVEFTIAAQGLPNDPELLTSVGAVRRRLGEFEQSARDTERALMLNPRDANLAWDIGVTYLLLGDYERAMEKGELAVQLAPNDTPSYLVMTYGNILRGDLEKAREVLEAMPPTSSPFAEYNWINLLLLERRFDELYERLLTADWHSIDHTTTHVRRMTYLGDEYRRRGEPEQATAAYTQALNELDEELKTRSDDARRHLARGLALASLGRKEEATAAAERAVELYPPSLDAFHGPHTVHQTAPIYLRVGEIEKAIDVLEQIVRGPQKAVVTPELLRLDPEFDSIRDHPRFRVLAGLED